MYFKEGNPLPTARPVHVGWTDQNDLLVAFRAILLAETDLRLTNPYDLYLTTGVARVTDDRGRVYSDVEHGALITRKNAVPQVVLTQVDLDRPETYSTTNVLGEIVYQVVTNRQDNIVIRVAEELYHLRDHLDGNIQPGTIERVNDPKKYEKPGHEQDALFYRFKLLEALNPMKWSYYNQTVSKLAQELRAFGTAPTITAD